MAERQGHLWVKPPPKPAEVDRAASSAAQVTQGSFRCNPSVEDAQKAKLGGQALRIYKALLAGPLWTGDLMEFGAQYNARVKELRDWLRQYGLTIDRVTVNQNGKNRYELRPYAGSRYQRLLLAKRKVLV